MRRFNRVVLLVVIVVGAAIVIAYGGLSATLSRVATREVSKFLAKLPEGEASCGEISFSLLTGTAHVNDVRYTYRADVPGSPAKRPGMEVHIGCVEVGRVLYSLLRGNTISVNSVSVLEPSIELWLDEKHPKECLPPFMIDSAAKPLQIPFKQISLNKLLIDDASLALHSTNTPLDVAVHHCSLSMQQLVYDSAFHFNDSVYSFSLERAAVTLPDGRSRFITQDIRLQAMGGLSVGATQYVNMTDQTLADNIPGADIRIKRLEVGPLSHSSLFKGELLVQAIKVHSPHMELWMDEEHPELCFPRTKEGKAQTAIILPFHYAELRHLIVHNASFALHSTRTQLDVQADSCSLAFHKMQFTADAMHCDTAYDFSVASGTVVLPDGQMKLATRQIQRDKQGIFSVGETRMSYHADEARAGQMPGVDMSVERIEIGPLAFNKLWDRQVLFESARVIRPQVELWLDEEHPERCFPSYEKKEPNERTAKLKQKIQERLPEGESLILLTALHHAQIENASLALHSTRTQLDVVADSCSLAVHDLSFDKTFHFNDTAYSFSLAHAAVTLPDGSMKMETRDIAHRDQGEIRIGASRIVHNMNKLALGDRVQEPVTWIDMQLKRVVLSPLNPIRKVLNKDYTIRHIDAEVSFMDILRDERYKLKHPTVMPQKLLAELPMTFYVKDADVQIRRIHIGFAITDTHIGHLDLGDINARVEHITNRQGYTMRLDGSCQMGEGVVNARFDMTMNCECGFRIQLKGKGLNTSFLNGFIRPFAGITSDCKIDSIYANYTGNSTRADGTFRMVYHDFSMKVNKGDDIPFEIITKHAGVITRVGNALVPKNNPPTKHLKPRGYQVSWIRNENKDVELYLFGPILDGLKKTFLPGLYVHLRTKEGEILD